MGAALVLLVPFSPRCLGSPTGSSLRERWRPSIRHVQSEGSVFFRRRHLIGSWIVLVSGRSLIRLLITEIQLQWLESIKVFFSS